MRISSCPSTRNHSNQHALWFVQIHSSSLSAPGCAIESLLQGIPGVVVYLEEEHLETLDEVLSRLDKAGLRVKSSKCAFMRESVTYLGHRIDSEGLHPLPDRIKAIREAPTPTSVSTLKSYLGYYSKFLPNLSTVLHPLYIQATQEEHHLVLG